MLFFFLITNVFVQLSADTYTEIICTVRWQKLNFLSCPFQNIFFLPAPSAPTICQSNIQCKSDGIKGFGCHDSPLRVLEHPLHTDSSASQFTGALLSQPPPWAASADQSCSRKSPLLPQVRFNFHSFIRHDQTFTFSLCFHSQ